MSTINLHENSENILVEQPTIKLFHKLGWITFNAYNEFESQISPLDRNERDEVVLVSKLRSSLVKLNPKISKDSINEAIIEFTRDRSKMSPIKANHEIYKFLKDGMNIKSLNKDGENYEKVIFIDWDNVKNNDFLLVSQLWITGDHYTRRPDLIGFVNGIPLLLVELKSPTETAKSGFDDNITDYKDTIPKLFFYNAFIIISNGSESKIGSTFAGWEHYTEWKKINSEGEKGIISLDTLINGTCEKKRFLDLIENYILFTSIETKDVKILGKNHQYLGVGNALQALENINKKKGRMGVFWHTQGSGKSVSMMFLSQKILRKKKGDWTFVIVTDRKELDEQIYKNFLDAGIVTEKESHAETCKDLQKLLSENHRFVFTLIHKFKDETKNISKRENVIVIVDEAHRTQYDTLALNMRLTLPNASFIAFTGTPLISAEEKTKEVFGDYVSKYDFKQSIEDKATVPLFYENRIPELQITNKNFNDEMAQIIEESELDEEQMKKVERKFASNYKLITDNDRLEKISEDIVDHFFNRGNSGKAMVICIDKATTIRMYDKVNFYWNKLLNKLVAEEYNEKNIDLKKQLISKIEFIKQTDRAVIVSQSQNEIKDLKEKGLDILPHRERLNKEDLDTNFKNPEHPLRMVFVCAMWLTGFDAPSCSTLYLDKPMKNHTLMQTIARANRVYKNKTSGAIIDYIGIFKNLQKALSIYGTGDGGESPIVDKTVLLKKLNDSVLEVNKFCKSKKIDINLIIQSESFKRIKLFDEAVEKIVTSEKEKKKYLVLVNKLWKIYKSILPEPKIKELKPFVHIYKIISKKIHLLSPQIDVSDVMDKIDQLLEDSIDTSGYVIKEKDLKKRYVDLSKIDFNKLKEKFEKNKNTEAELLKNAVKEKVLKMVRINPSRTDFFEKLQKIINDYNNNSINVEELFKLLTEFVNNLNDEDRRHFAEQLTEEELTVFDILTKPHMDMTDKEIKKVKKISRELLIKLKKEKITLDWRKYQASRASVKVAIKDELETLPECYNEIYNQKCKLVYQHIYENYFEPNNNTYT